MNPVAAAVAHTAAAANIAAPLLCLFAGRPLFLLDRG